MPTLTLPTESGALAPYTTGAPRDFPRATPPFPRIALAAAHVVADPLAEQDPWLDVAVDWDRTIAYRKYLWSLGLGVAEAMDTAQRGMGLDWTGAQELIRRSLDAMKDVPGAVMASGAGTDHLAPGPDVTVDDVIRAYEEQCEAVEAMGGRIILMASRALAKAARGPDDYVRVYDRILGAVKEPVIIHWLGEMFDPALEGYWGNADHMAAMETALQVIHAHAAKVDGVKISLLDKDKEIAMRRRLPKSVRMYTGDDFNYAELIAGDAQGHSDALLGIFDPIAPAVGGRAGLAGTERPQHLPRDPGADGPALPPRLQGADALLQDGRGLHGLAERAPGPFRDGGRAAIGAVDPPFRRVVPPGRQGRAAARPGDGGSADASASGRARRGMRCLIAEHRRTPRSGT